MAKQKMKLWEIDEWCEEVKQEIISRVRLFTIDVLSTCIKFSPEMPPGSLGVTAPFSKGHFIANWNVGYTKVKTTTSLTMNAVQKIADIESVLSIRYFETYSSVHMTNNLSYADNVENVGWTRTSAYAPVAKTANLIRTKYF